jgi:hypothetical protein
MLRHAWSRDYNYCPCGPLGDSAGVLSLCAGPYRTIACGERTLKRYRPWWVCISRWTNLVVLRLFFTVELLPLFAEMFGRFCLNRARQSHDENLGRPFYFGADHHRIRDLFGCRVDER